MRFILRWQLFSLLAASLGLLALFAPTSYAELVGLLVRPDYALPGPVTLACSPARYLALRGALAVVAAGAALALALGVGGRAGVGKPLPTRWRAGGAPWWEPLARLSRAERVLAGGLLLAAAGVRLWYAWDYPLNMDEIESYDYSVLPGPAHTASCYPRPNNHVLANLLVGVVHGLLPSAPPLVALRLLPTLLGLGLLPWGYALLLRYLRFGPATVGWGLFNLSPLLVLFTVAGRGYCLVLAATLVGLAATLRLLRPQGLRRAGRQRAWLMFSLSALLGLYAVPTHVGALLGLGLGLLVGFSRGRGRRRRLQLLHLAGVTAGIALTAGVLYAPIGAVSGWSQLVANPYVRALPSATFWAGLGPYYLLGTASELLGQRGLSAALFVVVAGATPWVLRRGPVAGAGPAPGLAAVCAAGAVAAAGAGAARLRAGAGPTGSAAGLAGAGGAAGAGRATLPAGPLAGPARSPRRGPGRAGAAAGGLRRLPPAPRAPGNGEPGPVAAGLRPGLRLGAGPAPAPGAGAAPAAGGGRLLAAPGPERRPPPAAAGHARRGRPRPAARPAGRGPVRSAAARPTRPPGRFSKCGGGYPAPTCSLTYPFLSLKPMRAAGAPPRFTAAARPGPWFAALAGLLLLAACAAYAWGVLGSSSWPELAALRTGSDWHARAYTQPWAPRPYTQAGYRALRALLGGLAGGAALLATALGFAPPGRRAGRALGRELAGWARRRRAGWRGLASGQRRLAGGLLLGLTALRVAGSLVAQPYDDATSYELFVRARLLVVTAFYPVPNNHVLANTLAWVFYQLHPGFWWSMRLPVLLASTGATAGWWLVLRRRGGFGVALLAVAGFGLTVDGLYYASIGRGYWLLIGLGAVGFGALLTLQRALLTGAGRGQHAAWLALVGSGVLGLFGVPTHGYFLASAYAWLGLLALRQRAGRWLGPWPPPRLSRWGARRCSTRRCCGFRAPGGCCKTSSCAP